MGTAGLKYQLSAIGHMSELVTFYPVTETIDEGGGTMEVLGAATTVRAKVDFVTTVEGAPGGIKQEKFTQEVMVQCRYVSALDSAVLRMLWRSNYYDIYAKEATNRKRYLIFKGRSITT